MELAIFNNPIPLKAIPAEKLNDMIMGSFLDWISATLSLNEDATTKLEYALPAIKEHCWSMGFPEIKKMIEMYADGKLSVKPIPNHFDRIKFGEVVNAYKQQKPVKKLELPEPTMTLEEKEKIVYSGCINCFEAYKQDKHIINGYAWVHDHLMDLKLLKFTDDEKKIMWEKAKSNLVDKSKTMSYNEAKDVLEDLQKKRSTAREVEYKLIRLGRYFDVLIAKNKHLKDYLK